MSFFTNMLFDILVIMYEKMCLRYLLLFLDMLTTWINRPWLAIVEMHLSMLAILIVSLGTPITGLSYTMEICVNSKLPDVDDVIASSRPANSPCELFIIHISIKIMHKVFILGCIYALPAYRDKMRAEGPKHIPIF